MSLSVQVCLYVGYCLRFMCVFQHENAFSVMRSCVYKICMIVNTCLCKLVNMYVGTIVFVYV